MTSEFDDLLSMYARHAQIAIQIQAKALKMIQHKEQLRDVTNMMEFSVKLEKESRSELLRLREVQLSMTRASALLKSKN